MTERPSRATVLGVNERTKPAPGAAYDEKQVAEILRRTAALEQKQKLARPTLTLEEIERIAKEAGMDPALVRQAALEVANDGGPPTFWARFTGAPLQRTIERVVEGELTVDDHEAVATIIRDAFQGTGFGQQIAVLGRSLSLATMLSGGLLEVQVAPKDGRTHVRISVNFRQLAGGLFGGFIGGIGGGLGSNVAWIVPVLAAQAGQPAVVGVVGGAAGLFATVGGAWALARALFSGRAKTVNTRADQLADALEAHLRTVFATRAGVTPVS